MSRNLFTVDPEMRIQDAIRGLLERGFSGAPVVDATGALVGMLSNKDCLKVAFASCYHHDWAGTVRDYMTVPVETMDADLEVVAAAERFVRSGYRRYPVLEGNSLVGQISRYDALRSVMDLW